MRSPAVYESAGSQSGTQQTGHMSKIAARYHLPAGNMYRSNTSDEDIALDLEACDMVRGIPSAKFTQAASATSRVSSKLHAASEDSTVRRLSNVIMRVLESASLTETSKIIAVADQVVPAPGPSTPVQPPPQATSRKVAPNVTALLHVHDVLGSSASIGGLSVEDFVERVLDHSTHDILSAFGQSAESIVEAPTVQKPAALRPVSTVPVSSSPGSSKSGARASAPAPQAAGAGIRHHKVSASLGHAATSTLVRSSAPSSGETHHAALVRSETWAAQASVTEETAGSTSKSAQARQSMSKRMIKFIASKLKRASSAPVVVKGPLVSDTCDSLNFLETSLDETPPVNAPPPTAHAEPAPVAHNILERMLSRKASVAHGSVVSQSMLQTLGKTVY